MILPSYHRIRPVDVGALISGGLTKVKVFKPFKIGIMPTGTEIVDVNSEKFEKGDIIDSNTYMLKSLVEDMGFSANCNEIVKDDYNLLKENIDRLTKENDIVFINAGSSAGTEDYTKDILSELGEVIIHGIAIKPGKPAILAIVNNKMVVGTPGYPVSCYIVFDKIIKPILNSLIRREDNENTVECILTKRVYSSLKHLEFVRVKVGYIDNKWVATPLARGAGVSMSLVECDGILEVPKEAEGFEQGDKVNIKLSSTKTNILNKIVCIGSHDLLLDFVKEGFVKEQSKISISSTHVGSFGGILALKNKECTIAPIHILDEQTGIYNIDSTRKFFKEEKMALIKGVKRQQGLIVEKGNPKNIKTLNDIKNHKFVNRQKGSGTYILLNYLLKKEKINSDEIIGFNFNVPTHFDVAINIKEGVAECGLGIYSVSKALDLDFVHIDNEEYDFLVYQKDLESEVVKSFIGTLKSNYVKGQLKSIGGYEFTEIGKVEYIE